jgi:Glycerol-3-phosphate dehydrogenase
VSGDRLSTLVRDRPVAVLSGPNMAEEIEDWLPAATVVASEDEALAASLQAAISSPLFRVYVNSDLIGVELCGAAKNVIALACGAVDGLGLGDNAKAALITRGLVEMSRSERPAVRSRRRSPGSRAGRPRRHVLASERPQPPGRRADRAGHEPRRGGRRDRPGGRGADHCAGAA